MKKRTKAYIIGIIIPLAVGGLSAFITKDSMDIYQSLRQPPLSPPGIAFPIVWTVLYILMGVGSTMVYLSEGGTEAKRNRALIVYGVQLAVNFFWSIFFFSMQAFLFSFVWLLLLWGLIVLMIVMFSRIRSTAAYLQVPYMLWVSFAGYLNLMVYLLNR